MSTDIPTQDSAAPKPPPDTSWIKTEEAPRQVGRALLWTAFGTVAIFAVALVAIAVWQVTRPTDFTLRGSVHLVEYRVPTAGQCIGSGGYSDINEGAQVTVTDAAGTVVAVGHLEPGRFVDDRCLFPFAVAGVPLGEEFYGITVASERRGTLRFPQSEVVGQDVELSLG